MRLEPAHIWDVWSTPGAYVGDRATHGVVTVEEDWYLNEESQNTGALPAVKRPIRWYQRASNAQTERVVPNVKSVDAEWALESDAATATITLQNQWHLVNDEINYVPAELGQPGYFAWDRGASLEAQARWGHVANSWRGVLTPGALFRTYDGFGGRDKTLAQAIADGNLALSGVWICDDVQINAKSNLLELICRNVGALLIDQGLYADLVPKALYPLRYERWYYKSGTVSYRPKTVSSSGSTSTTSGAAVPVRFYGSSVDKWYPSTSPGSDIDTGGFVLHGHKGSHSIDRNQETFALSVGNANPEALYCADYWQYHAGNAGVNAVRVHPWRGPYTMYVSVMEDGEWLGTNTIPYDHSSLCATQRCVDTGADIPYIIRTAIQGETPLTVKLPRTIRAELIRITFRDHVKTDLGPYYYRCGIREFTAYSATTSSSGTTTSTRPYGWGALVAHPTLDGYWTLSYEGKVHAFGDCIHRGDKLGSTRTWVDMAATPDGNGYWLLSKDGWVSPFGNAVDYGHTLRSGVNAVGIARTPSGQGYWVGWRDGVVTSHGDAVAVSAFGNRMTGIAAHPTMNGGWRFYDSGTVVAFGAANWMGDVPVERRGQNIVGALSGHGYMAIGADGGVRAQGSVEGSDSYCYTQANHPDGYIIVPELVSDEKLYYPEDVAISAVKGFWVLSTDGKVVARCGATFWGSPASGHYEQRRDGNYCADEETEILTRRGWLRWDEVEAGDEGLAIDPNTGCAAWQVVTSVFREHRDVEMILMEGRKHSSLTTPDHRWLLNHRSRGWEWSTTESLTQVSRIPTAAERSDVPVSPKWDDRFVELVAWFWTEGSLSDGRACLSQSKRVNPGYAARIERCLRDLYGEPSPFRQGGLWYEMVNPCGTSIYRVNACVRDELIAVAPDRVPTPEFLCDLTAAQLELFVDTSIDADGHRRKDNGVEIFGQKDERRIRAFEMACVLAGRTPNTTANRNGWSTTICASRYAQPVRAAAQSGRSLTISRVPYSGVIWCPTLRHHNWLARRRGSVYFTGNTDYADIVKDILLWAGFWLQESLGPGDMPQVYGNIESTGIYAEAPLGEDFFDKKPAIDPIKQIREVVGFLTWVDEEGAFHFESGNVWAAGNFDVNGQRTDFIPEIDERIQLTGYSARSSKKNERSAIVITTDEPTADFKGTVTTRYPTEAPWLRGMKKPLMYPVPHVVTAEEQKVMAQLIALHIWFSRRAGSVECLANPLISINDQVRIYERQTGEVHIHYVRAKSTHHDFETGVMTMTLTTNWLGTGDQWAITAGGGYGPGGEFGSPSSDGETFVLSPELQAYLQERAASSKVDVIRLEGGLPAINTIDTSQPAPDPGSADGES